MWRSARPWLIVLVLASGWLATASPGWAEASVAVELDWQAPAGCPSATEVRAEIDQLLGGPIDQRARADLMVRAAVERREQWFVTLATRSRGADGHRTLESATCQGLASATALIVALMIDPDAVAAQASRTKEAEPAVRPARTLVPVPVAPARVVAPAAHPSPRTTFGISGMGAAGHLGVLPAPDVGLAIHLGVVRRSLRIELRGVYGPREVRSDPLAEAAGAYGKFRFWAANLTACWMGGRGWARFGPCVDMEVGVLRGQGVRATETTSARTLWYGTGGGGVLVIEATPWLHFPFHFEAVVPWRRPNYVFKNVDEPIFRPWPVGARLSLAAEARF